MHTRLVYCIWKDPSLYSAVTFIPDATSLMTSVLFATTPVGLYPKHGEEIF